MIPHTKKIEAKIRRVLRKIKTNLTSQEYSHLYRTGSCPGKFYSTPKMYKILPTDSVDKLPIRPILSNINTLTYKSAKYLAKLMSPLSRSQYTVNSTKHFIEQMKHEKIPTKQQMIQFDVKSLFTGIPLDKTIEIKLQRIYYCNKITTQILKKNNERIVIVVYKKYILLIVMELFSKMIAWPWDHFQVQSLLIYLWSNLKHQ